MEARISKEKGGRDVASIKELTLNDCKSKNVAGLSEDWKSLENLNLVNVGLTSLKGFPRLQSLKKLELSKNNLSDGLDALACLPKLEELNLSANTVKDLEAVEPLAQVNTLKSLKLKGCDICKIDNYKEKLFELIPSLEQIDGEKKPKESPEENGVGPKNGKHGKGEEEDLSDEDDSIDDSDDDEDSDSDIEEVPLEALYGKINDDEEDDEEFEAEDEEDDEDIEEEEEEDEDVSLNVSQNSSEETEEVRGTKRKHEDEQ